MSITFPGEFVKVLVSTVGGVSYDHNEIKIKLRDNLEFFDDSVLRTKFTGAGGIYGDSEVDGEYKQRKIKGNLLPLLSPQLIDRTLLMYLITDDDQNEYSSGSALFATAKAAWKAYDGGVEITRGSDYSSLRELELLPPSAGQVKFYFGDAVYMRLGSSPVYDVRVYAQAAGVDYIGGFLGHLPGVSSSLGLDLSDVLITDPSETYLDFVSDQAKAKFFNVWTDKDNNVKAEIFTYNPASGEVYEFTKNNIDSIRLEQRIPAYKISLNCGQTFPGTYASGASDENKALMSKQDYLYTLSRDIGGVKGENPLAKHVVINTRAVESTPGSVSAEDLLDKYESIHETGRKVATVIVKKDFNSDVLAIDINDVVKVTLDRFGMSSGEYFTVIGLRHDYARNLISFTLWG